MNRRPQFDAFALTAEGIQSAAVICNKDLPPLKWVVEGLIPLEGITLLVAPPKAGKSVLVTNIAVQTTLGHPVLDYFKPQGLLQILYIDLEGSERRTSDRISAAFNNHPLPTGLHIVYEWPRIHSGGLSMLYDYAAYHPETKLIIIDTFGRIQREQGAKSAPVSYKSDVDEISIIQHFCYEMNVSVILVHHTRKTEADNWIDTVSGTQGIAGSVDTILKLKRQLGESRGTLIVTGRDVEDQSFRVRFDRDRYKFNVIGADTIEDAELTDAQRDIVICLRTLGEPASPTDIAASIGKPVGSVKRLLANMIEDGKVIRIGYGKYCDRLR